MRKYPTASKARTALTPSTSSSRAAARNAPEPRGRYDAPGDPPLSHEDALSMGAGFSFDARFAERLVRRGVNPKEAFTVRDAKGLFYRASLKDLRDDGGSAVVYERMPRSPEPAIELTLACAVLARQRMIFVAQKATELGVTRLVPLLTERSVAASGLEHEKAHAWPGQLVRAAKQCRRASLPELSPPTRLDALLADSAVLGAEARLFMEDRDTPEATGAPTPAARSVLLVVGPEGGFTDGERGALTQIARPWSLGGRVLRAETAVLVGLTAVHIAWGDYRGAARL